MHVKNLNDNVLFKEGKKMFLFNNTLNTFYYVFRHIVMDHLEESCHHFIGYSSD